jgi:hypothetical protein
MSLRQNSSLKWLVIPYHWKWHFKNINSLQNRPTNTQLVIHGSVILGFFDWFILTLLNDVLAQFSLWDAIMYLNRRWLGRRSNPIWKYYPRTRPEICGDCRRTPVTIPVAMRGLTDMTTERNATAAYEWVGKCLSCSRTTDKPYFTMCGVAKIFSALLLLK